MAVGTLGKHIVSSQTIFCAWKQCEKPFFRAHVWSSALENMASCVHLLRSFGSSAVHLSSITDILCPHTASGQDRCATCLVFRAERKAFFCVVGGGG